MQIQECTIVSNPKGGNQAPSIRICVRHVFHVFSTPDEKRFFIKKTFCACKFKNLLPSRARRGIKSALYQNPRSTNCSCFLDILWKTFFYQNDIVCMQIQEFTIVSNPKGDKKAPSIRIRVRHIFHVFSTSYEKRVSIKMTLFFKQIQEFTIVSKPKGDKKTPSIRICVRHVFHVFSTYYEPGTPYSQPGTPRISRWLN